MLEFSAADFLALGGLYIHQIQLLRTAPFPHKKVPKQTSKKPFSLSTDSLSGINPLK